MFWPGDILIVDIKDLRGFEDTGPPTAASPVLNWSPFLSKEAARRR
jgi:hypothetical protein